MIMTRKEAESTRQMEKNVFLVSDLEDFIRSYRDEAKKVMQAKQETWSNVCPSPPPNFKPPAPCPPFNSPPSPHHSSLHFMSLLGIACGLPLPLPLPPCSSFLPQVYALQHFLHLNHQVRLSFPSGADVVTHTRVLEQISEEKVMRMEEEEEEEEEESEVRRD